MISLLIPGLLLACIIGALITLPSIDRENWRRLPQLLVLGAPPLAAFVWSWVFRVEPGSRPHAIWIEAVLWFPIVASVALPIALLRPMAGARRLTAFVGLCMVVLTVLVAFIGAMAISGDWI